MKIITKQSVSATAAERWRAQYCHRGEWSVVYIPVKQSAQVIYEQLLGLGACPSSEAVNLIIGNSSWGYPPWCDECGQRDNDLVVQVGQEPDYESATANLCMECVRKLADIALTIAPNP